MAPQVDVPSSLSNYIFILDLTPGFIGLGEYNCTTSRETSKFGDLVRLILEILRYLRIGGATSDDRVDIMKTFGFSGIRINFTDYLEHAIHMHALILGLRPSNERRRYNVTTSLIGWVQASLESALLHVIADIGVLNS